MRTVARRAGRALPALIALLAAAGARAGTGPAPDAIALLYSASGPVRVAAPGEKARDVREFEWLRRGTRLLVGADARAVLAFRDGRREELTADTDARLEPSGVVAQRGYVRDLPALPALADVLALATTEAPGPRAGAVRIRSWPLRALSPHGDEVVLADETVLSFEPVPGAPRYRVEVIDRAGASAFELVVEQPPVPVPADKLRPGAVYSWTVRTIDRAGPVEEAREWFRTLPAATVDARKRLRAQAAGDPDGERLLAAVDQRLGLAGASASARASSEP